MIRSARPLIYRRLRHLMPASLHPDQLQRCWSACWARARRPVEGLLLPEAQAAALTERAIRETADELPHHAVPEHEFLARALERTSLASRQWVAEARRRSGDPQLHRDPEDKRYERNLDLDRLQLQRAGTFADAEWNHLPPLLRPLAFIQLFRRGMPEHDAEELFNDSLAALVRCRVSDGRPPILDPTVFEELIPLHLRILGFRAIDWFRRRDSLKNRPNEGESIDAMADATRGGLQFEDLRSTHETPTFERIYMECREALDPQEWELIFALYVADSSTIQELIMNRRFCRRHGLGGSTSTRRRTLSRRVEEALEKIRKTFVS